MATLTSVSTARAEAPSMHGLLAGARPSRGARVLALGAVVAPIVFTLAWLVLGALSPGYEIFGTRIAPYSPITQPISGLGLGVTGPSMNAAFIGCGLVLLLGVIGLTRVLAPRSRWMLVCLAIAPIGMLVVGTYTLEAPLLHLSGAALAFFGPVLGFLAAGLALRRQPGTRRLGRALLVAAPLTLLLVVIYFVSFDQATTAANQGIAGLTQRVAMLDIHAWYLVLGLAAVRWGRPGVAR
jgi:hypothetical membrane protein